MNNEITALHEVVSNLTDDPDLQHKLQTDYPYRCKKHGWLYADGIDTNGNSAKVVKLSEFYHWIKEYRSSLRQNIPPPYRTRVFSETITFDFTGLDLNYAKEILNSEDINQVKQGFKKKIIECSDLKEEIKELKAQLTLMQEKLDKKQETNKKKGKRSSE